MYHLTTSPLTSHILLRVNAQIARILVMLVRHDQCSTFHCAFFGDLMSPWHAPIYTDHQSLARTAAIYAEYHHTRATQVNKAGAVTLPKSLATALQIPFPFLRVPVRRGHHAGACTAIRRRRPRSVNVYVKAHARAGGPVTAATGEDARAEWRRARRSPGTGDAGGM